MQAGIGKSIGALSLSCEHPEVPNATISIFFLPINPVLTRNLTNCPLELTFAISLQTITACAGSEGTRQLLMSQTEDVLT
jgi:hypothetical protein